MARVSAINYHETLWSELYPGSRHTIQCLRPAVEAIENAFALTQRQQQRVVWRLDGGSGSDEQLTWLIQRGYHVLAKGYSNRRAEALARRVLRWHPYREDAQFAEVEVPVDYGRPVRIFVKRRTQKGKIVHSYYLSTLRLGHSARYLAFYDDRGAAEVEQFRTDKSGLNLCARRKHSFYGQLAYILLTDLAHNLLADFQHRGLTDSKLAAYGPKRIVRDLLTFPGRLIFDHDQLVRVELDRRKLFAKELAICLNNYFSAYNS